MAEVIIRTKNGSITVDLSIFGSRPWHYHSAFWTRSIDIACDWSKGVRPSKAFTDPFVDDAILRGHIDAAEIAIRNATVAASGLTLTDFNRAEAEVVAKDYDKIDAWKMPWWGWLLIFVGLACGVTILVIIMQREGLLRSKPP